MGQQEIPALESDQVRCTVCVLRGPENLVWQVNRQNGTEHPAGQSDPLTSLFPSGKTFFFFNKTQEAHNNH